MANASPKPALDCFTPLDIYWQSQSPQLALTMAQQAVSLRLAAALLQYAQTAGLGQVLHTPGGILLSKHAIQPHVLFVARERSGIIGKTGLHAPPDLIVDILSSRSQERQFGVKRKLYAFFEIREYWVVDPDTATIEVMIWSELGYITIGRYGKGDRLYSPLLPRLDLRVSSVFVTEEN
jgi:Uma2 family endonuclease